METQRTGRVWKFGDRISTDFMVPGHRVLANPNLSPADAAKFCMEANRPGWAENEVQAGDIIVGGINFGCGSSRNGSGPLKQLGIAVVLAESIARIHLRNAVNTGLPTLVSPGIGDFVEEGDQLQINIVTGELNNLDRGTTMYAEPWEEGTPPYEILMAGGLDAYMRAKLKQRGLVS
ncbi:MAG: 3-isopropylmalate dehydratase [Chromatiales bacterium]|jgi:3-isopropylmalate/(R)-2-methylmalate dehydratase small subunit|nr:3-isopropylmalate dehydratase [Chromatiales bacterium]